MTSFIFSHWLLRTPQSVSLALHLINPHFWLFLFHFPSSLSFSYTTVPFVFVICILVFPLPPKHKFVEDWNYREFMYVCVFSLLQCLTDVCWSVQSVQLSHSVVSDSSTPWIAAHQASLSITNSQSSLRLTSIGVSDAIQPSHPLSSPSPPAPNPSQHQGLFQWVNSSHEVAKVLEFQL